MTRRKLTPMLFVFRNFNSHSVVCRLSYDQEKVGAEACGERNRHQRRIHFCIARRGRSTGRCCDRP
jgi:hypothetical protein